MQSRELLVMDNVDVARSLAAEPYLRAGEARSILCLPMLSQAKLTGVLYLENRLAPHVFVPARVELLKVMASQAAIALENSRLYEEARRTDESPPQGEGRTCPSVEGHDPERLDRIHRS
ncbi:GAF domain-containing protein [Cupriavidus basilensis]